MPLADIDVDNAIAVLTAIGLLALVVERATEVLTRPFLLGRAMPQLPPEGDPENIVRAAWSQRGVALTGGERPDMRDATPAERMAALRLRMADDPEFREIARAAMDQATTKRKHWALAIAVVLGILTAFLMQVRVFEALGFAGVESDGAESAQTDNGDGEEIRDGGFDLVSLAPATSPLADRSIAGSALGAPSEDDVQREENPAEGFTTSGAASIFDTIVTGLLIAGGSDPIHQGVRKLQEWRKPAPEAV